MYKVSSESIISPRSGSKALSLFISQPTGVLLIDIYLVACGQIAFNLSASGPLVLWDWESWIRLFLDRFPLTSQVLIAICPGHISLYFPFSCVSLLL